jgi:hypothetical protein
MLVPGTAKVWQTAIRPADLKALAAGIAKLVRRGQRLRRTLRGAEDFCDELGATSRLARCAVGSFLKALREAGVLAAERVLVERPGCGRWVRTWLYDPAQLDRVLAGRDLLEAVGEFWSKRTNSNCAGGEPATTPAAPPVTVGPAPATNGAEQPAAVPPPRRFRRMNKRTLAMSRFCFDEYVVKDRTRPNVWRDARREYGPRGLSEECTVTRNANRYQETEEFWRRCQPGGDLHSANWPKTAEKPGGTKIP